MSLLTKKYRETRGKDAVPETRTSFAFKTGIDILDHKNGRLVRVRGGKPYLSTGIDEGSYIMIIGRSGGGKTAIALQMAANIVKPYANGAVYHDDVEAATDETRFKMLSGWSDEEIEDKYVHRSVGITAENFYKNIRDLYNLKMEMKDELTITTDRLDSKGRPIEILEPTVYVLDSLAVLVPEKFAEEDDLSGSMSQTAIAKVNSQIFQRIIPLLKKANIILIAINHVNQKIDINPMAKSKAQINYLKQDETIPGGNKPIYLANNIFRVDPGKKLSDDSDYGINGFLNTITIIKSRSNRAGQTMEAVYDQNLGYDNVYSNYHFLKGEKLVGGAGRSFYLSDLNDVKFSQKDFGNKVRTNKDLRLAFRKATALALRQFIYIPKTESDESEVEETESKSTIKKATTTKKTTAKSKK